MDCQVLSFGNGTPDDLVTDEVEFERFSEI